MEVLHIRDYIHENDMGEVYECCLYGVFFFLYDYPFINAILRVGKERKKEKKRKVNVIICRCLWKEEIVVLIILS